jgi:putative endonuclease
MRNYYVYILTNRSGSLYTGVTNNLERRLLEHRQGKAGSFTARYKINRLVYFEHGSDVAGAIEREKEVKSWTRQKRVDLINSMNPRWEDLSAGLLDQAADDALGWIPSE